MATLKSFMANKAAEREGRNNSVPDGADHMGAIQGNEFPNRQGQLNFEFARAQISADQGVGSAPALIKAEKLDFLQGQPIDSGITTPDILKGVISLIFDKAFLEPTFCPIPGAVGMIPGMPGLDADNWKVPRSRTMPRDINFGSNRSPLGVFPLLVLTLKKNGRSGRRVLT
uniref:Uncharacterized protein n=1 Tax=Populus trichocarpa TaxID=3694 RepID=A0A2K1YTY1_POPTR